MFKSWNLILAGAGLIVVWLLGRASYETVQYLKLGSCAVAIVDRWRVEAVGSSQFAVAADYRFAVKGRVWNGTARLPKPYHLNQFAAEREIQEKINHKWTVWYQASHPSRSALDRYFPLKAWMYGLVALGVLGYFLWLKVVHAWESFSRTS